MTVSIVIHEALEVLLEEVVGFKALSIHVWG
jgi:hypothetical protein